MAGKNGDKNMKLNTKLNRVIGLDRVVRLGRAEGGEEDEARDEHEAGET